MLANPLDKYHSLPNIRGGVSNDFEAKKLYSFSLSHLRKNTEFSDYIHKPSPFSIRWVHGYNPKPGAINLNDMGSTIVFYAASFFGILYNWTTNQMRILQGHRHAVTCLAADATGRWLVTADSGPENTIIIWDASDYFPQKTIFSPHGTRKLAKAAISADAKYLMTLAYSDKTVLHWWIWSYGDNIPQARLEVELPRDSVIEIGFNPYNTNQFLLLTKHDIWIGEARKVFVMERGVLKQIDQDELKIRKVEKHLNSDVGKLTCYTFVDNTSQVLVGTSRGSVLIYGYSMDYQEAVTPGTYEQLKFIKVLKIEKHKINVIKSVDGVIVTGSNAGEIHFYDEQMKLVYWMHGFQVDSIRGLSFNISPRSYQIFDPKCKKFCPCWEKVVTKVDPLTGFLQQKLMKQKLPDDATTSGKTFVIRDFIVCTNNDGIGFVDFATEKLEIILNTKVAQAMALAVHPDKPYVTIGYSDGFIDMLNFVKHRLFKRLDLREYFKVVIPPKEESVKCNFEITVPHLSVTCLKYSPSGLHLACGLSTGELMFLDPTTMEILNATPFKDTSYEITEINYSEDSLILALADAGRTVLVYKYNCTTFTWSFIGKHRAHYKDISTVFFLTQKNEKGDYKLLSLGLDRIMVEYDIGNSKDEYLEVLSLDRVDQAGIPLAGIVWPAPQNLDPEKFRNDLPIFLMATNEFKYKIVNFETTMTLSTILGPRFEQPVCWMQLTTRKQGDEDFEYLVFSTKNTIGLQKMPLDGNPWKYVGVLGHPIQVTQRCYRGDMGILFTIGSKDCTMCQWSANYSAPDTTTKNGGGDLNPYYCLFENGQPGWLFQEIRDMFYYIQILCQGTFSPAMRRVKDYVPIDSLPDMMRALGFFPSEYEVENLIVEAKYKVFLRCPATEIDFEEFVKLYLNHRPAFGDNFKGIQDAFRNFASYQDDIYSVPREQFIDVLGKYGEHFSRELTWYVLSILSGESFEDRAAMSEDDFSFLPENITFNHFLTYLLGIQEVLNTSEPYSALESASGSQHTNSTTESE